MDDLTLLAMAAGDGDHVAFAAFMRVTQVEVWRLACHLVGPNEADDVTQDTFVRAWRALPAYRGDASPRTWLLSIARRACVDALRRQGRGRRLAERLRIGAAPDEQPDPVGESAVTELLGRIEPDRREAFVLTQIVGCSYAEASEICGVPVGTIRSRVARARTDLIVALRAAESA